MIVIDSGPLVALSDAGDADHQQCTNWFLDVQETLVIPAPLIAEICYMISTARATNANQAEATFLRDLVTSPRLEVATFEDEDYLRMADLVEQYSDFPLGAADASVIAVAERLKISTVATLDHRHFRAVRPSHIEAFTLVP
jgi:uncharacterized protein